MTVRWGVMGTGGIVPPVVEAIRAEGGEVLAIASGDAARAAERAASLHIPHAFGRHHDLLSLAPDLDAVYIATTNDRHHADLLACIAAGVPVLAEKPFTMTLAEAEEVVAAARAAGVFVMEGMWMRFQPVFVELERRIAAGEIGEPLLAQVDFGIAAEADRERRWFSDALGGGALLDVGVYALTLVTSLLGTPTEARALGVLADTGVDASVSVAMRHGPQRLSSWSCSLVADTGIEATISGAEGNLRVHAPFHQGAQLTLRRRGTVVDEFRVDPLEVGYHHEVSEVHRCLTAELPESERMPLALSLTVMRWLDELRRQVR